MVIAMLVFDCAVVGFAGVKPLNITFTMARPLPIYPLGVLPRGLPYGVGTSADAAKLIGSKNNLYLLGQTTHIYRHHGPCVHVT